MLYGLFHRSGQPVTKEVTGRAVTRDVARMCAVFSTRRDAHLWRDDNEIDAVVRPISEVGEVSRLILIRNERVSQRINAIKAIRELMGVSLREARAFLDDAEKENGHACLPLVYMTEEELDEFYDSMKELGYCVVVMPKD